MSGERYTAAQMIEAIQKANGIKTVAARRLGCNRHTVTRYIEQYATVREAYLDARLGLRDLAESQLVRALSMGDWKAIAFTLTHMNEAGEIKPPTQRHEHTGEDGDAIRVQYVIENRKHDDSDD